LNFEKLLNAAERAQKDEKIHYRVVFNRAVKVKRKSNNQVFHADMAEAEIGAKPARAHLIETDLWENLFEFDLK
jgi:hypothetical protein